MESLAIAVSRSLDATCLFPSMVTVRSAVAPSGRLARHPTSKDTQVTMPTTPTRRAVTWSAWPQRATTSPKRRRQIAPARRVFRCLLPFATALLASSGCRGLVPGPELDARVDVASGACVPSSPPPARIDDVPPRPQPQSVWIDGEWSWSGRAYVWRAGAWVVPPVGSAYAPQGLFRLPSGALVLVQGQWRAPRKSDAGVDSAATPTCPSPLTLDARVDAQVGDGEVASDGRSDARAEPPYQTASGIDASIDTNAPLPIVQPPP